jgi:hypothetical protein
MFEYPLGEDIYLELFSDFALVVNRSESLTPRIIFERLFDILAYLRIENGKTVWVEDTCGFFWASHLMNWLQGSDEHIKYVHHIICNIVLLGLIKTKQFLKENYSEKLLNNSIELVLGKQLTYVYLQIVKNFPNQFSNQVFSHDRQPELDLDLAVKMYQIYWELFDYVYEEKGRNILQESDSESILIPNYVSLVPAIYKSFKSMLQKEGSYHLQTEGLRETLADEQLKSKALDYFDRYTSHIEIINFQGDMEKKYFFIPPVFRSLTSSKKSSLWITFNTSNAESLCLSLFQSLFHILSPMISQSLLLSTPVLSFTCQHSPQLSTLTCHLILLLNFLVLISQGINRRSLNCSDYLLMGLFILGTWVLLMIGALLLTQVVVRIKGKNWKTGRSKIWRGLDFLWTCSKAAFMEITMVVTILFAILGYFDTTLYWGWLVFVVGRQKSMMNVLKAVWVAKYLLIATILLVLISIYFFAVFSVLVLKDDFSDNLTDSWDNVWQWSITIFDSWYKSDGNIGGWLSNASPSISSNGEYNTNSVRILHDFAFNLIVGILLLEIFSGILTDTFAKIRSKEEELSEIQRSRCFIWNKENKELINFKSHTQHQHNLWDYIIYSYILINSPKYSELKKRKASYFEEIIENKIIFRDTYRVEKVVEGIKYLEAMILGRIPHESSDEYIMALIAHYEMTKDGLTEDKPLKFETYLSWLPFNATSKERNVHDDQNIKKEIKKFTENTNKEIIEIKEEVSNMVEKITQLDQNTIRIEEKLESIITHLEITEN